ncbi:MAG: hypothetical protein J4G05_09140 [Chlorobi bacterium]|nr:hypothetical protein [Chlorobiota bacterium]
MGNNRNNGNRKEKVLNPNIWQLRLSDTKPKDGGKSGRLSKKKAGKKLINRWTKEEDALLRQWYPKEGSPYLEKILDRTRTAIQARAEKLRIPGTIRTWTRKEEVFLKHNYKKMTAKKIAQRLKRTEQSVRGKLHKSGLTAEASRKWSEDELEYLRKHYGITPVKELAVELERSMDAVEIKAGRIGLARKKRVLTPKEKSWVIRNLGKIAYLNMAKSLGVSPQVVQKIAHANGYRPKPNMRPWTKGDIAYLRKSYGKKSRKEIAMALGRSVATVQTKASDLQLTNPDQHGKHRSWLRQEEQKVKRLYGKKTHKEIAEILGRSVASVAGKIAMLGIGTPRKKRGSKNDSPPDIR